MRPQSYSTALNKEEVARLPATRPMVADSNNARGRLRTLELVQGRGELRPSGNLFDAETG